MSNNTCPDEDCLSKDFGEIKNNVKKKKLESVGIICENKCGESGISFLNYYEHLKSCKAGIEDWKSMYDNLKRKYNVLEQENKRLNELTKNPINKIIKKEDTKLEK